MNLRAYKYRLYPTKDQQTALDENFNAVRFIWNQLVASFNHNFIGPTLPQNEKIIKDCYPFLNDSISYAIQQKRMDFVEYKKQFFNKNRKLKVGRAKFKKKGVSKDSFRIPGQSLNYNKCIDFNNNTLKIPKLSSIKIKIDREFRGQLRSVTISKNKCNQYFVSVLVEEEIELKQNTGKSIGIDLGIKDLLILSNGIKIENPKLFRENQSKLRKAQKHLSRKQFNSNRYKKQKLKVAKIHLKVSNTRNFVLHNLSSWLVTNFDNIITEDLKVSNMIKNRKLSKSIQDASWSSLVSMLEYKCNWYGKTFYKIGRFYPSSKLCSKCGYKLDTLKLNVRNWKCPSCGEEHDRDLNAAINILEKGIDDLYGVRSAELPDLSSNKASNRTLNRRGEELNLLVQGLKVSSMKRLVNFIDFYEFT